MRETTKPSGNRLRALVDDRNCFALNRREIMGTYDPVQLLFGGMEKLGPGSDADTRHALKKLPKDRFELVIDAGCGTGRQTIVLAKELRGPIHAIDSHPPFLDEMGRRAEQEGVASFIQAHCMDMAAIPQRFSDVDLLWSEGAAYNIGFANALASWAAAIRPGGLAVISELAWLQDDPSPVALDFFRTGYPDMKRSAENISIAQDAGYAVLDTHILPRDAWLDGYYKVLGPRAQALVTHQDPSVREFAQETLREIEVLQSSGDSYGYVFYVLHRD